MSLCLYECLRAVGLQRHHAKFTSVGICRAAHLSALTMEDYPVLGISSLEERTRLFNLVQVVKTLDLDTLEYEDDDGAIDEDCDVADSSLSYDDCGEPDGDVFEEDLKGACGSFSKPSTARRRLDFSSESIDHHQKLVDSSHPRNYDPSPAPGSAIPVQHHCDQGSASFWRCKGYNHHNQAVGRPDCMEESFTYNTRTRFSPTRASIHKPKPRPVTANAMSNNPVHHKAGRDRASGHVAKPTPVYESKRTAGYNYGLPLSSPLGPNKKQQGGQRISVCVRKRPLTRTESRREEPDVVTTPNRECVIVHEAKEAVDLTQYILQHRFYFDQVFGEESSNQEVYLRTAYPLVQHMLNGGKATCFAYGQTGAGKTHTMLGSSPGRPGLYALAVRDIFAHLSTTHARSPLSVCVSFFEIYCGQLYDLLDHRKRLFAREDGQKTVHIAGLRDVRVESVRSLLEVIAQGTEERTQGVSGVNPHSSRSHALLQIQLRDVNQQIYGRMWFVDLAGSERASDTKEPDRQSRMEGAEINQSLLALKECIRSLDQEQSHTPFRQSKLTQVLKDSFIGDSMTCMIANISPGHLATEHTLNTLRYADRVKELRGQGGLRGGRKGRTIPSPKRNLSNSSSSGSSSIGARGKSPPKKPKLVRQREAVGPTTPTTTSPARKGAVLCSTPKDGRRGDDARAGMGIGLEDITPVRGVDEQRNRRRKERYGNSAGPSNIGAGMVLGQEVDEGLELWEAQRGSGLNHRARQNLKSTLKVRKEVERIQIGEVERVDDQERKKHLRQYHQQLQQFTPLTTPSSSALPFSPSSTSFSSCSPTTFSSSASSSTFPSSLSLSAIVVPRLDDVLDPYGARVDVRSDGNVGQSSFVHSGEISSQTSSQNKDPQGGGWRETWGGTEAVSGRDRGVHVKRRSLEATGQTRARREERGWAWVSTTETEQADGTASGRPADVLAPVSNNCDSRERRDVGEERLEASDVWITEEREDAGDYCLESSHRNSDSLFNQPRQRAPAERPLSPPCEHTNTPQTPNKHSHLSLKSHHGGWTSNVVPLSSEHVQQGVPSSSCGKKEITFAAEASRREFPNGKWATPTFMTHIAQNDHNAPAEEPEVLFDHQAKSRDPKMAAKPPADCLSYDMEPLSISLLQVDRQVATTSFLQGDQSDPSEDHTRQEVERGNLPHAEMPGKGEKNKHRANGPIMHLSMLGVLDREQLSVIQAHLEQLEEMAALCHKEGTLLCQQPDMAFGDYVHKLEEIMEKKAQCVHSMIAQLQPYLKPTHSNNPHK